MIFVGGDGPGLDGGKAPESEPKPFGMEEGGGGGGKARLWLRGCSRDGLGGGELLETEKTVRMRAPHHCRIQEEDRGRAGEGGGARRHRWGLLASRRAQAVSSKRHQEVELLRVVRQLRGGKKEKGQGLGDLQKS